MTRINCVPVQTLSSKHLVAEWHEIGRVVTMVERQIDKKGKINSVPANYCMGKGHMQFFANKLGWIAWRIGALHREMMRRRYKIDGKKYADLNIRIDRLVYKKKHENVKWHPSKKDVKLNYERLFERDEKHYVEMV